MKIIVTLISFIIAGCSSLTTDFESNKINQYTAEELCYYYYDGSLLKRSGQSNMIRSRLYKLGINPLTGECVQLAQDYKKKIQVSTNQIS